jgi:hypothetical protein
VWHTSLLRNRGRGSIGTVIDYGRIMNTYFCEYSYKGDTWTMEITASSWEEAEERVKAIQEGAKVRGVIRLKIPVPMRVMKWITSAIATK